MFIPRHPVVENQFCSYSAQTSDVTGVGGVICYAGAVVFLVLTVVALERAPAIPSLSSIKKVSDSDLSLRTIFLFL